MSSDPTDVARRKRKAEIANKREQLQHLKETEHIGTRTAGMKQSADVKAAEIAALEREIAHLVAADEADPQ